jgi:hypothetical protein
MGIRWDEWRREGRCTDDFLFGNEAGQLVFACVAELAYLDASYFGTDAGG